MTEGWKQLQGQVVDGRFSLQQYLGSSDDSAVFLTKRESQKAAIKLRPVDAADADLQLSRWTLATSLSHPHLIRLFEAGRCELAGQELLYVVMEYAEENLGEILPQRPLTPAETKEMLSSLLDALTYLHGKRLAHGHIKPANILACGDQLKISCDGICGSNELRGSQLTPGPYDPPEFAEGKVSSAGDVWSLGVTLIEVLTQHIPLWKTVDGFQQPVIPESLPEPFRMIAAHCLLSDPQARWTVADIASCLQSRSPEPQKPALVRPKSFAKWIYAVPAVAAGLALVLMFSGRKTSDRPAEVQQARLEPQPVQAKPEKKQKPSPTGRPAQVVVNQQPSSTAAVSPAVRVKTVASRTTGRVTQGAVAHQVLPDVPQKAKDTIQGKVRVAVRVAVDPAGNVVGAAFDSRGPSKYFAGLALQAARGWRFTPPQLDGQQVASDWILRFEFERRSTRVSPAQATP
jgi:TonB family protein